MNVLFMSVSIGAGHIRAAEAIREALLKRFPGSKMLMVDTLKFANPLLHKVVVGGYLNMVKNIPGVYGKLYELSETGEYINDFSKTVNRLISFRFTKLLDEFKPSIIVCTHPFPMQMLSNLRIRERFNCPVIAVLTDFVTHSLWVHENVDAYIVANEYMKLEMADRGVPRETVHPYGIPLTGCFSKKRERTEVLRELGLEDKPTFLLMGGSLGLGEICKVFKLLLDAPQDIQILAVTGRNGSLGQKLQKLCANTGKGVRVFGYTDRISDLMDAADFLITKPGGMTIAEALAKQLPMLLISPIPGQEEGNAQFLVNSGAALRICLNESLDSILRQITCNPMQIKHMREMAGYLARPASSDDTVDLIARLVNLHP